MTNLPGHGDLPAGMPLDTWTGTLTPSTWRGGCLHKQYEVTVQIRSARPTPKHVYTPGSGESFGSRWFRCVS